ncbi:MAG: methionine synthase [Candidatus Omnitrophica bacterium]|nr:methionine synthase [Candidatus Omnitrophota bacterium]MBU4478927.1 methionine synthase [Candidatus Omnitrophota bacterium]MCG2704386.1 methionine synthase [Candidatus Omnitrophota bacterium]
MKVHFFDAINVVLPQERIYSRLGFVKGKTRVAEVQKARIEQDIIRALELINLQGAAVRCPILEKTDSLFKIPGGLKFSSKSLLQMLQGCEEVIFMAATAGKEIVNAIAAGSAAADMTGAVVFDAVASEMTDAGLEWIMEYYSYELRRENKFLTKRRFSSGYGDFSLENQKNIGDILQLEKIGVRVTPYFLLEPEKSVTAVAGITPI